MPVIEGGFGLFGTPSTRQITVSTESTLRIFENVAVVQRDQYARALGLYGDVALGRDLEARFMSFSVPKHLLSPRKNGCTWTPKGGLRMNVDTFGTCPVEFDGTQCSDAFYGTCMERLFGTGNEVKDFYSTPEAQGLLAQMLTRIYQGLGNSFFDLYNFANHPLIDAANTNGTYAVAVAEWEDYIDQMLVDDTTGRNTCAGLITQLDALKAAGNAYYTMDIPFADITVATNSYTGSFTGLIEDLIAAASPEMKTAIDSGMMVNGRVLYPIILATSAEFNAYKAEIRALAGTNELAYRYMIEGMDGVTKLERNVLMYDNMPIVRWDAHSSFDAINNVQSHRVAIVAPGVFGVLHDIDPLAQFDGLGLIVEQSTLLRDKKRIDMTTTFRWGAGIADPNFAVMASNIIVL